MKNNQKKEKGHNGPSPHKEETPVIRYRSLVVSYLSILARIEKRSIQDTPQPLLDSLGVSLSTDRIHCTTMSVKFPDALGKEDLERRISRLNAFIAENQAYIPPETKSRLRPGSFNGMWPKQKKIMEAKMKAARELLVEKANDVPAIEEA